MRWLVLLLFAMPALAQAPSGLEVTIEEHAFDYGPEDWKDARPVEDQATFTERTSGWNGSLGASLTVHVKAVPVSGNAENDWTYQAWLSDGVVEVEGVITPDPVGRFYARFDIDGQRALPGQAAIPALVPGTWALRVTATSTDASGNPVPEGNGRTTLTTTGLDPLPVTSGDTEVEHIRFPEQMLPGIMEVGPGDAAWFNRVPFSGTASFAVEGEADWRVWTAVAPPLPELPIAVGTQWQGTSLAGTSNDGVTAADVRFNDTGIYVVAAIGSDGGLAVWVFGVGDPSRVVEVEAPAPGESGSAVFHIDRIRAPQRIAPSEAFALGIAPEAAPLIARTVVLQGPEEATASFDARALRAAQAPYRMVAMLHEGGAYSGHAVMDRGVDVQLDVPTLTVGQDATVQVRLASLSSDAQAERGPGLVIAGQATIVAGEDRLSVPFQLVEGGAITVPLDVTPAAQGALAIAVTVDTGDTFSLVEQTVTVRAQDDGWSERLTPGPSIGLLLLAIALGRKR